MDYWIIITSQYVLYKAVFGNVTVIVSHNEY
jgi:hypothetical protein